MAPQRIAPAVFRLEVKDSEGKPAGTGAAFAISADGLAVTNFHVIENGATYTARTTQGAEFTVSAIPAFLRHGEGPTSRPSLPTTPPP